ncbi:hypothetical protein M3Y99_00952300 [Aphelenchoides fujianensis]|nr:hypothetical protein M3Y99_00952300 [Aphelenchoides fujianensis]
MTDGTKKLLSGLAAMFNDGIHWDFVVKADPLEFKEECRRWAFVKMSVKDVLEWLTVGYTYEDGHLTHGCLDFFFRHMEEVQALPEFPEFVEQNPPIAVELLRLVTADRKQLLEVNQMQKDLIEAQKNKLERRNRHE